LRDDGLDKVMDGLTTVEEVLRVTQDIDESEPRAEEEVASSVDAPGVS